MLFTASKLVWLLLAPGNLILLVGSLGAVLLWTRWIRLGRILVSLSILLFGTIAVLPVDFWLARPLEARFEQVSVLPDNVDGIIVLSGELDPDATADHGQPVLNDAAERLTAMVSLSRRFPQAKLVYGGGSGRRGGASTADHVAPFLESVGLDPARVHFESASRNTFETAVALSKQLKIDENEIWLLVTSAQHMPRAVGVFRRAGLPVRPYQVDYRIHGGGRWQFSIEMSGNLERVSNAAHEWIGLVAYRALGRTGDLFPAP